MARISAVQRRSALVQAALRVIARDGVAAATTRAVVAEAGMSLASFHYAFRSREELISELIVFVIEHEIGAASQAIEAGPDGGEGEAGGAALRPVIRAGLSAYLRLVVSDPSRELAMFELVQYAMRTPGLNAAARAQYDAYYGAAGIILDQVAARAGIAWRYSTDEMARILITLTDGLTLGWLVDRNTEAAERVVEFAADALTALATAREAGAPGAAGKAAATRESGATGGPAVAREAGAAGKRLPTGKRASPGIRLPRGDRAGGERAS